MTVAKKMSDSSSPKHKILQLPGGNDSLKMLHFHFFVSTNALRFKVEYSVFEMTYITIDLDSLNCPALCSVAVILDG